MLQVVMALISYYIWAVAVFQDCDGPAFDFLLVRILFYVLPTYRGAGADVTRCFLNNNHMRCFTLRDHYHRCLR